MHDFSKILDICQPRPELSDSRSSKKNYAERFSRNLAQNFADALRPHFPEILPTGDGGHHESKSMGAKGLKKLDINYSTPELGLGLGVSIKTVNFPDQKTKRFTKNYSRIDNELRAEATDYHRRQPYAVIIAILFLPIESCLDAKEDVSSFGAAVRYFRPRTGRTLPQEDISKFEAFLIGLYSDSDCFFFDVAEKPPRQGLPTESSRLDFGKAISIVKKKFQERNSPEFEWAD